MGSLLEISIGYISNMLWRVFEDKERMSSALLSVEVVNLGHRQGAIQRWSFERRAVASLRSNKGVGHCLWSTF
jgi:hypothetical protein